MNDSRSAVLSPVRLVLASIGLAFVWLFLSFVFGSDSARADDRDRTLLGGVVSDVVTVVEAPVVELGSATGSVVSAITTPDAAPAPAAPVATVVPAVRSAVAAVVDAKPVSRIVTPVAATVDEVVAALPVVGSLPVVSDVLGDSPLTDVTTPVTGVVDEVLAGAIGTGTDATLPGLPSVPSVPSIPVLPDADGVTASVTDLNSFTGSAPATSSWAATMNTRADASPAASARPHPDPVPQGPADNGQSAPPTPSGANSGAASGGPAGPVSAADNASGSFAALIHSAALSPAENDAVPSSLAPDLSSTPD